VGRRALRGGAKGYCKNANRTSPGGLAERLCVAGRNARARPQWTIRGGLKKAAPVSAPAAV